MDVYYLRFSKFGAVEFRNIPLLLTEHQYRPMCAYQLYYFQPNAHKTLLETILYSLLSICLSNTATKPTNLHHRSRPERYRLV
jgi:hypothetical protein